MVSKTKAWVPRCGLARWRLLAALGAGALFAGCGGGVFIGIGGDQPPEVSLAAGTGAAHAGDTVRLVAAAADDFGVDRVEFYRIESDGGATRLGVDGQAPFQWDTVMPSTSASSVQFFARAVDGDDQSTDSDDVSVAVLR